MTVVENKGSVLMKKYEIGRLLGKGAFAKVYYARDIKTSQSVAIKVIDKEKVFKIGLNDQIMREISVMRMVRHPNVLELYEVMATRSKIYFVLEYAKGGELFNKVVKGKLREDVARKYFQQLISAIDFSHSRGVYHRDLKPENLLLDENGNLKISDFGLSALAESKRQDGLLHTTCGTPAYVAPEVIGRKGYYGAKADVWSCGVILFVLMAGSLPFHDSNLIEMYRKIGKSEYRCPNWFPLEVRRLLSCILDPNPATRISTTKIMENPWFRKALDGGVTRKGKATPKVNQPNTDEALNSLGTKMTAERQEMRKLSNLNAFDIISLSDGFDLSGLFEEPDHKSEARFISAQPASSIISKLEDVAKCMKFKIKKDDGVLKMEGSESGKKGALVIDAEIFEVTPSLHLVEMKKTNGDTLEYRKIWKEDIRPALKDIVWAWQGEEQQFSNLL